MSAKRAQHAVPVAIAVVLHGVALFAASFVRVASDARRQDDGPGTDDVPVFQLDLRGELIALEPAATALEPAGLPGEIDESSKETPTVELAHAPEPPAADPIETVTAAQLPPPEVEPEPSPEPVTKAELPSSPSTPISESVTTAGTTQGSPAAEPSSSAPADRGSETAQRSSGDSQPPAAPASPPATSKGSSTNTGTSAPSGSTVEGSALQIKLSRRPAYPEGARRRGEEGTVTCRLTIDRDGRVLDVEIQTSSGFRELDLAAVRALENWRFEPIARLTDRERVYGIQRLSFELARHRKP